MVLLRTLWMVIMHAHGSLLRNGTADSYEASSQDQKESKRREEERLKHVEKTCRQELVKCGCDTSILNHDYGTQGAMGSDPFDELEIKQAGVVIPGLHRLEKTSGVAALAPVHAAEFAKNAPAGDLANLTKIMSEYQVDKVGWGYLDVYADIFNRLGRNKELSILEVGMGTNNKKITSHMASYANRTGHKPGASLRGWRDYLPKAHIFGADLDPDIMMKEERIETHVVDQLDYASFETLHKAFNNRPFDVIIDDAIHTNVGNLNTIAFGLSGACKKDGWIVIEDVGSGGRIDFFSIIKTMLKPRNIEPITIAMNNKKSTYNNEQLYMFLINCP